LDSRVNVLQLVYALYYPRYGSFKQHHSRSLILVPYAPFQISSKSVNTLCRYYIAMILFF